MSNAGTSRPLRDDVLRSASRHPLAARVAANLRDHCGIAPRAPGSTSIERVIVGCSGGPDSTALLVLLTALAGRRTRLPTPIVVAVHHGLRPAADEECAMVARLARQLGLTSERIDVRPAGRRGNVAANARDDRYAALIAAAARHEAGAIAVAHHADDRFETMLLALARGRGLRGLATPRWRHELQHGIALVRPLLDVVKSDCVELCDELGLPYVDDPSNLDPARARGHLRRGVIPALTNRWPAIAKHATKAADEAALAIRAIDRLARRHFGPSTMHAWPRDVARSSDAVLLAWALRRSAVRLHRESGLTVSRTTWERVARAARDRRTEPRIFQWPMGLRCVITSREIRLERGPV
ncbi:MAG: tRNA lysidine(34) synthetase TilS [Phycisphaerae bacterium]|nr:tRNA lysidine(34) synthetase TilS [Phycisphaerae bacterium]